jgi:hypothetical protein
MPGNKIDWIRYGAETGSFMAVGNQPAPQLLRQGFQHSTTYTQLDNFFHGSYDLSGEVPISGIQIRSTINNDFVNNGRVVYLDTSGIWTQADASTVSVYSMLGISPIRNSGGGTISNKNILIQGWVVLTMGVGGHVENESIYINSSEAICQGMPLYLGSRGANNSAGILLNVPPSTIDSRSQDRKIANLVEFDMESKIGLVWFDPSLCLPNIAPEGEEIIYYGAYGDGNEGCRIGDRGTQYTLYFFGGVVFTDPGLTTPFNGGDLWYYDPVTNTSYQINSSGVIVGTYPC